jgi:DNA-binding winged helix-turn-helix (wHTH) protein/lipoprotein NlpI
MRRTGRVYDFGPFRLDPAEQVLLCADKPVHLTLKAFSVLHVLVENAGHVVEKDELMRLCWPDAYVEEANLAENIFLLRRALSEVRDRHDYVETVHRRGYRFIAKVSIQNTGAGRLVASDSASDPESMEGGLTSEHDNWLAKGYADYREAHHLYRRGRYYWHKYTVEGLNKGIDYFRQAIRIDPDYPLPYTGLADCYYRLSNIYLPPRKAMPKAKSAVMKALKRDATLAEAHALLGLIRMFYDHDWPVAENEFTTAIRLAPGSALAHKRYGWALGLLGRFDEAITEINRALDLDPRSSEVRVGLGIVLHLARRHDAAIVQAQRALDTEPEFFPARVLLGIAQLQQSRFSEGIKELQKAASLADVPWTLGYLGYAYGVSGKRRQALKILTELEKRSERAYVSPYAVALIHSGLGHKEEALQSLMKTYEDRNEMAGFIKSSPEFDDLRSAERFAELLR